MQYPDKILQNEIHLWTLFLDDCVNIPKAMLVLSPDEIERSNRFVFEKDRNQFIVGRSELRKILSKYTSIPAEQLLFTYNKYGKPSIDDSIEFNCSHSDNLMVIAFTSGRRVGVDIEKIKEIANREKLANYVFTLEELEYFHQQEPSLQDSIFFRLWTRKEALLKATGVGIGEDLQKVSVVSTIDGAPSSEEIQTVVFKEVSWRIATIPEMDIGFCGTICYEGKEQIKVITQQKFYVEL